MNSIARVDSATLLGRLADEALAADPMAMPAAVEKAKICLIDFLSCAFEARDLPWSRQAVAIATPLPKGANIVASDVVCSAQEAAFANGVLGHGLVREDMHAASIAHLGVVVWPALLALAQRGGVSGGALLAAAITGYEVGGRFGGALMTSELARLFRPTGLVGPLAAALAGARLLGLDADTAVNAASLAVNTSSGLNQWPHTGGSEMYFHPGFAARNAIAAIALAEAGAVASDSILEGEAGMFAAFARRPFEGDMTLFADGGAEILAVFNKPVPACNFAQSPCQAALQVAREIGAPGRVRDILIETSDAGLRYPGCDAAGPFPRPLQAKMSIPFGVAATLARGAIAEENYARLDDAEIRRLISLTTLRSDPRYTAAFPAAQGARVTVTLDDGAKIARELNDVVFATPGLVRSRFRAACGAVLGEARASAVEAVVDGLEDEADAGRLPALCALAAGDADRVAHGAAGRT
jgi:2-methylcitrate dehydratase PrpD